MKCSDFLFIFKSTLMSYLAKEVWHSENRFALIMKEA